jgi:hypothetical protein
LRGRVSSRRRCFQGRGQWHSLWSCSLFGNEWKSLALLCSVPALCHRPILAIVQLGVPGTQLFLLSFTRAFICCITGHFWYLYWGVFVSAHLWHHHGYKNIHICIHILFPLKHTPL